jgi:hypothetical protein
MKNTPYQLIHLAKSKLRSINTSGGSKFDTVVEAQRVLLVALARNPALPDQAVAIAQDAFGLLLQATILAMGMEDGPPAAPPTQWVRTIELTISSIAQLLDYVEGSPNNEMAKPVKVDSQLPTLEID